MTYNSPCFAADWSQYLRGNGSYDLAAAYTDLFGPSWYAEQYLQIVERIMPLRDPGAATVALATAHAVHSARA